MPKNMTPTEVCVVKMALTVIVVAEDLEEAEAAVRDAVGPLLGELGNAKFTSYEVHRVWAEAPKGPWAPLPGFTRFNATCIGAEGKSLAEILIKEA